MIVSLAYLRECRCIMSGWVLPVLALFMMLSGCSETAHSPVDELRQWYAQSTMAERQATSDSLPGSSPAETSVTSKTIDFEPVTDPFRRDQTVALSQDAVIDVLAATPATANDPSARLTVKTGDYLAEWSIKQLRWIGMIASTDATGRMRKLAMLRLSNGQVAQVQEGDRIAAEDLLVLRIDEAGIDLQQSADAMTADTVIRLSNN